MIATHFEDHYVNLVVVHDTWAADLVRYVIMSVSSITAALLLRLYTTHRTGRMNRSAGIGAVSIYIVVSWAQIVGVQTPVDDLTALNLGVLFAVGMSMIGTIQASEVRLFKKALG